MAIALCLLWSALAPAQAAGEPVIQSFTATPDSISPGEPVTLAWTVLDATSVKLDGLLISGNSTVVSPIVTSQYVLQSENANGSVSATVRVQVVDAPDFAPVPGRFVEVVKHGADTRLHIGEIEVFAFGAAPNRADADGTSSNDLVQAGSPATVTPPTTTMLEHGNPATVFDGDLESGAAIWSTLPGLAGEPRYMLDLGATQPIGKVLVWGRADTCCVDRLQNFSVNVYADNGAGQPGALLNTALFPDAAPEATVGAAELDLALPDPGVRSFSVDRPLNAIGGPLVLSWEVHDGATSVFLDQGIGDVTALTNGSGQGSIVVDPGPIVNTTYSILVTRPSGASTASQLVEVTDRPVIYSFSADQFHVEPGTEVQLSWAVGNATSLDLNGASALGTTGLTVTANQSTDYVLTAQSSVGSVSKTVRVRVVTPGEPIISEFMASNRGEVTVDMDGDSSDWIELCNPSTSDASLDGYYLTDDRLKPAKWRLPNIVIPAGGYRLVFASGKDRRDPALELHTSFSLNDQGEYLALVNPDGVSVVMDFHPKFPVQRAEVSYGLNNENAEGYFLAPTPGAPNGQSFTGFVGDTSFSVDRGFFSAPIELAITTTEPGAQIRFTTDGTKPTAVRGRIYTGPIAISRTTVVRAAGFKGGFVPTNVDTQTYLFPADIIRQPAMSTSITQHPVYGPRMNDALQAVPSLSLVFLGDIDRTEKECSVEFINFEEGSKQFDAGMARFGNYVTDFPKRGMRLTFRSQYGPSKLRFPVFEGHEYVTDPAAEVDGLDLRSGNHDMNQRGAYMSNRFTDDSMDAMGNIAPHGRFVHIYVNGLYWGQYHMRERWNAAMLAEYFPGPAEQYESINANNTGNNFLDGTPTDGTGQVWNQTKSLVRGPIPFRRSGRHLDIPNVIDFMLLWVCGNSESEFRSGGSVRNGVPFKFFMKDADGFLRPPAHPVTHPGPIDAMANLMAEGDPDFKIMLADRIHKHFFNDGALTPTRNIARLRLRTSEIQLSFYAESARWGYRTPADWQAYQDNLIRSHFPSLTQTMINQFKAAGMYPSLVAPSFSQHGGVIPAGFELGMSAPAGTLYYTLDGSDPRVARTGSISVTAAEYAGPLTLNETTVVRARVLSGSNWSALNEAVFAIDSAGLVVSEFMYDPLSPSPGEVAAGFTNGEDFEFFELLNTGATAIDLSGMVLDQGIGFNFSTGAITTLAPGARLLVVENIAAFEYRYGPGRPIAGQYTGKLDDGGELVRISNALNSALIQFTYDDKPPWPIEAAGNGSSLVLIDPDSRPDPNDPASWAASATTGGSPGRDQVVSFTYAAWAAFHGVTSPGDDDDKDGLTGFEEFVRGSSPLVYSPAPQTQPEVEFLSVGGLIDSYLTITFTSNLAARGVTTRVEASEGLQDWTSGPGAAVHVRTIYHGDGTATSTWRSATPAVLAGEQFLRVVWEN